MRLRRFLLSALALPAAVVLAGCSSAEGQRAQELLLRADAAQKQLTSSSFEGSVAVGVAGQQIDVRFEGAGSQQEGYMSMRASGVPGAGTGAFAFDVVVRGGEIWMAADGDWQKLPAAAAQAPPSTSLGPAAFAELARHVKAVRVTENQLLENRPVAIVAGEIDTAGLVASLAKLGGLGELAPGLDVNELGSGIGDIEAVLTIDEQTGLLSSALVTLSIEADGQKAELRLTYRLTSWNEPVTIPSPGA
jgi:hypothetical protein